MRVRIDAVVVIYLLLVDIELFVAGFHDITADPDDAFNEIFVGILGKFKYNDIAPLGCFEGNDGFVPVRNLDTVEKFVDQDVIADLQGLFHRP